MKIAIIGSRNLNVDISKYVPECFTGIISGGAKGIDAKGIDALAETYANKNNTPICVVKPEYNKYRKAAPLKRNEIIVDMSDLAIVIWDGKSRGTKYVIEYTKKVGKPVEVHIIQRDKKDTLNS